MGRLHASALVLACVLVLAGCSGFTGGGPGNDGRDGPNPSRTVTPAPVPTTGPTATPGPRIAPGLATTGVVNASALADAHEARLEDASLTLSRTTTYRYGSGEIARRERVTTQVGVDGERLRVVEHRPLPTASTGSTTSTEATTPTEAPAGGGSDRRTVIREVYWFGSNRSARAITYANGTTAYRSASPRNLTQGRRSIVITEATRIAALAGGFETRVRRTGEEDDPRYRVVSTGDADENDRTRPTGFASVSSFRMTVTPAGSVGEYRLVRRLTVQRQGKPTEIVTRVRYTDVGTTTVSRPSWYDDALHETNGARAENTNTTGEATTRAANEHGRVREVHGDGSLAFRDADVAPCRRTLPSRGQADDDASRSPLTAGSRLCAPPRGL